MILLSHLNYSIGGNSILKDVSLRLAGGQMIALIGPNGAGKSTLFAMMARLIPINDGGQVYFGKHNIATTSDNELAKVVSMLSQENHIQGRLRVKELLMFGRYPYHKGQPKADDHQQVQRVLEQFELTGYAERFLSELSGGQKQRVLIAMIICQDTPYVLLDEPLNNLDMYHAGKLMRILYRLVRQQSKTVVIVLHDVNQAAQFADTIVMMKNGKIKAQGKPSAVLTQTNMQSLFGVTVTILNHHGRPVVVDAFADARLT